MFRKKIVYGANFSTLIVEVVTHLIVISVLIVINAYWNVARNARKQRFKMAKIKVELEVPENCKNCMIFDDDRYCCMLFGKYIPFDVHNNIFKRCDECKQAEVKEQ